MLSTRSIVILVLATTLFSGCVRRRMTVRSSPPGATVYVDDQEIGVTPVSTAFTYYGTRKLQLVKDGYETQTLKHKLSAPWYQIPPLDFISENLIPQEIRDERIVDVELEPQRVVPVPELLGRAGELRRNSQLNFAAPATFVGPSPNSAPNAAPPLNGPPPFVPPNGAYPQGGALPPGGPSDEFPSNTPPPFYPQGRP